jgi:hypothetical protein
MRFLFADHKGALPALFVQFIVHVAQIERSIRLNQLQSCRFAAYALTMSPVLVLADMFMSAVKRETQAFRLTCAAPATVIKRHSIDDRSSLKPLCKLHGKVRRSCLLARIPARTGGNAANGDVRDAIRSCSG